MARKIAYLLVWVAIALLLILPYALYPPVSAHVGRWVLIVACLIIAVLAISGLKTGRSPLQVLRKLSLINYVVAIGLVLLASVWGWLMVGVLGIGQHFFSAVVVAIPGLALIATALNLVVVGVYVDVGLGTRKMNKRQARKQAASSH